ncbi:hypothetical protein [Aphanizomenon flos-aquae]|nr:hypothetical protein [Aphanizomenon flos-aquae]
MFLYTVWFYCVHLLSINIITWRLETASTQAKPRWCVGSIS